MTRAALDRQLALIAEQINKLDESSGHEWIRLRLIRLQAEFRRELERIDGERKHRRRVA